MPPFTHCNNNPNMSAHTVQDGISKQMAAEELTLISGFSANTTSFTFCLSTF